MIIVVRNILLPLQYHRLRTTKIIFLYIASCWLVALFLPSLRNPGRSSQATDPPRKSKFLWCAVRSDRCMDEIAIQRSLQVLCGLERAWLVEKIGERKTEKEGQRCGLSR